MQLADVDPQLGLALVDADQLETQLLDEGDVDGELQRLGHVTRKADGDGGRGR